MHKTRNTILIIAVIVIVGCLLYIPGMKDLGLYRDDWNNYYDAVIRGADALVDHYASDRPADGWLLSILFRIFGTNNNAYLIWNLCCRILSSVFFALTLLVIWPRTSKMAGLAGILAVAFPAFLQQVDGIAYVPHQTAMLFFMLSLWLTALACKPGQTSWNVLFTFLSMIFSFAYMMLMEYYVGMEFYRFAMIYLMNREQAGNGKAKAFFKSILSYLPYLIPAAGFVFWRTFNFQAERIGADVIRDVVRPLLADPYHELLELAVRTIKSMWKLFAGVWTIPAYTLINGLSMKDFVMTMIPVLVIFAVSQLFLFLMHRRKTEEAVLDADNESAQWLWCGLITGTLSIMPMIAAGRDINFTSSLERFAWVGMIGTILFLVGVLGSLRNRALRNLLTMAAIILVLFVQWQNKQNYIYEWQMTKDYWQQLMWRAPGLKQGATIVTQGELLIEEDYDVFAPAQMIYYPGESEWCPIGAEVINRGTIQDVKMQKKTSREVRNVRVVKDYQALLAITKPYKDSCLRVIDGNAPVYSPSDWTGIHEIGSYSRLDQIITDPETPAAIPFFLGEEQVHGWCYYYEKMELALQKEDPETAAKLADEAAAKDLQAGDDIELIPVIEAYVLSGRTDEALQPAAALGRNEFMAFTAVNYFSAKADADLYADVISAIRGNEPEEAPDAVTEEAPDEGTVAEVPAADETAAEPEENADETDTAPGPEADETAQAPEAPADTDPAVTPDAEDKNARETAAGPEAQDEAAGPEPESGPAGSGSSEVIYVIGTESAEPESTPEVISDVL